MVVVAVEVVVVVAVVAVVAGLLTKIDGRRYMVSAEIGLTVAVVL